MSDALINPRAAFIRRGIRLALLNVLGTCAAGYCLITGTAEVLAGFVLLLLQFPIGCLSLVIFGAFAGELPRFLEVIAGCLLLGLNACAWGFGLSAMVSKSRDQRSAKVVWNRKPLCLQCGYDLRGSRHSDVCPECGWQIPFDYQHWPEELEETAERLNHVERDSTSSTSDT